MNIGAIGGGGSAVGNSPSSSRPAPPSMTETAKLLGMSGSELKQQLQSGKSLESIASSKGVSHSAVVRSVESDLKANAPGGAPSLSGSQLTQLATRIASGSPQAALAASTAAACAASAQAVRVARVVFRRRRPVVRERWRKSCSPN